MKIDLSQESERLACQEVEAGRFRSPQEFVDTAIKQFLIAREFGESEARKLACLGAELNRADEQIDLGECSEFDEHTLKNLFEDVEAEGMRRLAHERATK
jgi:Arc/MetJ-type ribon-helix-helix transcriptional regulator